MATTSPVMDENYATVTHINQYQLSKRWNISQRTLEHWRWERIGPSYLKMGRRVVYALADIEEFEKRNRQEISPKALPYYQKQMAANAKAAPSASAPARAATLNVRYLPAETEF